jgi:small subunit ribosomal protein S2
MNIVEENAVKTVAEPKKRSPIDLSFQDFDFGAVEVNLESMLKSGVHFGHLKSRLHPRMADFVFITRDNVNIIDLEKTEEYLGHAEKFLVDVVKSGKKILFVGMKKHTHALVRSLAIRLGEAYVVDRWLGGTLTNFKVVGKRAAFLRESKERFERGEFNMYTKLERLKKMEELERLERKMGGIQDMRELPGAIVIADAKDAKLAIAEAHVMNIPVVAITDTNTDPSVVEYPIPGNDDALSSLRLLLAAIGKTVFEAKQATKTDVKKEQK